MKFWIDRCLLGLLVLLFVPPVASAAGPYLSPVDIAVDSETSMAYIALGDSPEFLWVDMAGREVVQRLPLPGAASGLAVDEPSDRLAVVGGHANGWCAIFRKDGLPITEFAAGFSPVAPVFIDEGRVLAVGQRFTDEVGFYRVSDGQRLHTVPVSREPVAAAAVGRHLFVANALPDQSALDDLVGASVDVIDTEDYEIVGHIPLPNGSSGLKDMAVDASGRYLFVTHILGRYQVPTSQLERGWMNTNALSIIDTETAALLATVLLDDTNRGAANPWGVDVSEDGKWLVVVHAGTHELSRIPLAPLLERVRSSYAEHVDILDDDEYDDYEAYLDPAKLSANLDIMSEVRRVRYPLDEGPRSVAIWGDKALVLEYFGGALAMVDLEVAPDDESAVARISLGEQPEMDAERLGELRFGDARLCFQQWQSCVSCHPGNGRTDALNWDLLNDGIGNPKQTKSLLLSHVTPPAMVTGIRPSAEVAVRAGIRFIQFAQVNENDAEHIDAYLTSLKPLPSPKLIDGELNPLARQGKEIFEKIGCAKCHSGPYHTDLKTHKMRYSTGMDEGRKFDTPTLVELWRTAPYLYDGRAATMDEALLIKSSRVEALSEQDRKALVEYVLSL